MSEERDTVTVKTDVAPTLDPLTEERIKKARAEKKARFARVLERGFIVDRLDVSESCPADLHAEWVNVDPIEIERKRALGYTIVDADWARRKSLNSDGSSKAIVGDVVLMACPKEDYELLEEVRLERFKEMHGPKKSQVEETQFKTQMAAGDQKILPVIDEGSAKLFTK